MEKSGYKSFNDLAAPAMKDHTYAKNSLPGKLIPLHHTGDICRIGIENVEEIETMKTTISNSS